MPSALTSENRLPRQRRDRRAAFTALALLLVAIGALGSALVVYRSGHRTDVLQALHEIHVGDQITEGDFASARVAADSGFTIPSSDAGGLYGDYATVDIPQGTLVNGAMFQKDSVLPKDGVVVGVTVNQSQRPASTFSVGDVVRAFDVPDSTSGSQATSTVLVSAARVTDVTSGSSAALSTGSVTVSVLVPEQYQDRLAAAAGQNQVLLALLPADTNPLIDFRTNDVSSGTG